MAERFRADFVLSPVFIGSLTVILVNDLLLKPRYPSWFSGIASDLAGMIFFPVFLVAVAELCARILPGRPWATPRWFASASAVIVAAFMIGKFTAPGRQVFEILASPIEGLLGDAIQLPQRGLVPDPWDLLALPLAFVPILIGRRWRGNPPSAQTSNDTQVPVK
jgi:hypothetical protein